MAEPAAEVGTWPAESARRPPVETTVEDIMRIVAPDGRVIFRITHRGLMRGPLAWKLWAQMAAAGVTGAGLVEAVRAIL